MKKNNVFVQYLKQETGVSFVPEYRFHPVRKWRFDYACVQYKVAIEVEGGVYVRGRHNSPTGYVKDMEKYSTAASMGWLLIRCTPQDLFSNRVLKLIKETLTLRKNENPKG